MTSLSFKHPSTVHRPHLHFHSKLLKSTKNSTANEMEQVNPLIQMERNDLPHNRTRYCTPTRLFILEESLSRNTKSINRKYLVDFRICRCLVIWKRIGSLTCVCRWFLIPELLTVADTLTTPLPTPSAL